MENKNNSVLYYSLGAIIFVIIIILMFWLVKKDAAPVQNVDQNVDQTITPTEDVSTGSVNVAKKVPSMSYGEALIKYKDARVQFDKNCQANPNNVTFKNNSSIMIDNRSSVARTIKVGSVYTIKAYGFKIVKLSSSIIPVQFLVDCDKSQNVATILLQK